MSRLCRAVLAAALLASPVGALAGAGVQPGSSASAETCAGMSIARLATLDHAMQAAVDGERAAGVVTYVARAGRVVQTGAYGRADREAGRTMRADTIFRIASQTKAVTSVAIMQLVERGVVTLLDPVSKYIPEFQDMRVAVRGGAPDARVELVPASRQITIRDLLTHTAGLSYGRGVAQQYWAAAGFQDWYFADRREALGELVARMAGLPLDAQPGSRFVYGYATDVLGVVVERASGQSLAAYFADHIFEPLGMAETFFYLPRGLEPRLAAVYSLTPDGLQRSSDPIFGQGHYVEGPRRAYSGGAGLLSTARDYGRFMQMLLNGGELDGARVLSRKSVELMTVNHVGDRFAEAAFTDGRTGFGLGFEIEEDPGRSGRLGSPGNYGWGGAYHTVYWIDPQERLAAMLLTQLRPSTGSDLHAKFRALVYAAVVGDAVVTPQDTCPALR